MHLTPRCNVSKVRRGEQYFTTQYWSGKAAGSHALKYSQRNFATLRLCSEKVDYYLPKRRSIHHSDPILHHLYQATVNVAYMMFVNNLRSVVDELCDHISICRLIMPCIFVDIHILNRSSLGEMRAEINKQHIGLHLFKHRRKINPDTSTSTSRKCSVDKKFIGIQWTTTVFIFGVLDHQICLIPGVSDLCT